MRHTCVLKQIAAAGLIVTFAAVDMNSNAGTLVESGDDKNVTVEPEKKVDWGKINVNIRLRYEYAEDENLSPSNAFTGRLRLGYTTPVLWGFQAMAEFEGTGTPDESSYRAANISGPASKTRRMFRIRSLTN